MQTITITTDELAALVKKEILAQTGSQSIKNLKKDQPSIDISTPEKMAAVFEAAGHKLSTVFIAEYSELRPDSRAGKEGKIVGGYGFITTNEKLGFGEKPKVWMKVSGLKGLVTLDGIQQNVGKLDDQEKRLKDALAMVQDVKAGFTAVYREMTGQNETAQ